MSEIDFTPFCGNPLCFSQIGAKNGLVLSCGCFLCDKCGNAFSDVCPSCRKRGVRAVALNKVPEDVASVTNDTAQEFENLFTALKFQIQHYKKTMLKAVKVIQEQNLELNDLKRYGLRNELVGTIRDPLSSILK